MQASQNHASYVINPTLKGFFLYFLKIAFYLKGRIIANEGKTRARFSIFWFLARRPPLSELYGSKLGAKGFFWDSCVCRDPRTWATFCYFPRHISKELVWKWSSQDSKLALLGMPVPQAAMAGWYPPQDADTFLRAQH